VSHAKNRTRKVFKPNLHRKRIIVEGRSMRVRLCTKCGRKLKLSVKTPVEKQALKIKDDKSTKAKDAANAASLI